jgi:hypothetical protein
MMGLAINWPAFSWEAFATLATGLAAVASATYVAVRQGRILSKQNELIAQQARDDLRLRKQSLKLELLRERIACLDRVRNVTAFWWQQARLDETHRNELRTAIREAEVLYSGDVTEAIQNALKASIVYDLHERRARSDAESGQEEKAMQHWNKAFKEEDDLMVIMQDLLPKMTQQTRVVPDDEPRE